MPYLSTAIFEFDVKKYLLAMNVQSSSAFPNCESVASHFEGSAADRELCDTKCYLLSRRSELQIHIRRLRLIGNVMGCACSGDRKAGALSKY